VPAGVWYHVAYVMSGKMLNIYVNGSLSVSGLGPISSSAIRTTRGSSYFGTAPGTWFLINAQLDEIRMYNRALSPSQIQLDMTTAYSGIGSGICSNSTTISTSTSTTTSTPTTSTTTPSSKVSPCLTHYWPIGKTVTDVITGQSATSKSPLFAADRNGITSAALWVNGSEATSWQLPVDTYFQGDTTVTMWVKKIACQPGRYSNYSYIIYIFLHIYT
jgi:hypothetical protein